MTEIVKKCLKNGLPVIYVYDELLCEDMNAQDVKQIMIDVCKEMRINVTIK